MDHVNTLEEFLIASKMGAIDAMNRLQDQSVISDLCLMPRDVAAVDCPAAIEYLRTTLTPFQRIRVAINLSEY